MTMRDLIPWGRQESVPAPLQDRERNPFLSLRDEVDRLFDDVLRGGFPSLGHGLGFSRALGAWPKVELGETEKEIRITAEIPGMNEKDVELLLDDGMLTIRGERKSETEDKDRGYSELHYGRFERRIALPTNVDEQSAKAEFKDGVLSIALQKSGEVERGRRIPINAETRH